VSGRRVCSLGGPLTIGGGSLCLDLVFLLDMCVERHELCFNFSLSISIYISTTTGSQLLSTPDPEQSSFLGWTLVRWVWAEEAMWHHSSMQVMGSQTGEFSDPPPA
jgi:hypothetical protein